MTATYEAIATTTLGSAQSSVTFSSISGSYTDLVGIVVGQSSASGNLLVELNSDTGSNYSATILFGDGTSADSARTTNATSINIGDIDQNAISNNIVNFQNYSNATTYKTLLGRGNRQPTSVVAKVGLWRSTSAITTIKFSLSGGATFNSGSTFTLYGIKAA